MGGTGAGDGQIRAFALGSCLTPPAGPVLLICGLLIGGCASTPQRAPVVERGKLPASAATAERYLVKAGDNLYRIALEHGLDYRDLARWNGLSNPDRIIAGTSLRLRPPGGSAVEVEAIESVQAPLKWVWPVQGRVIAEYDQNAGRKGIQVAAPYGSPVIAAAAGRVVYAGHGLRGYGKLTILRHGERLLSAYAHQSRILVREGDLVSQGQLIGEVGDSDADRAKLHFEIREYGRPLNPRDYLPS